MMVTCVKDEMKEMGISDLAVFFIGKCFHTGNQLSIFANSIREADDVAEHRGGGDCLEQTAPKHLRVISSIVGIKTVDGIHEVGGVCGSCGRSTFRIVERNKDV